VNHLLKSRGGFWKVPSICYLKLVLATKGFISHPRLGFGWTWLDSVGSNSGQAGTTVAWTSSLTTEACSFHAKGWGMRGQAWGHKHNPSMCSHQVSEFPVSPNKAYGHAQVKRWGQGREWIFTEQESKFLIFLVWFPPCWSFCVPCESVPKCGAETTALTQTRQAIQLLCYPPVFHSEPIHRLNSSSDSQLYPLPLF
jgi:hypothetical protein